MTYRVRLDDLAAMTGGDRSRALASLIAHARKGGPTGELHARIREFELRYELTSENLLEGLRTGAIKETADISKWLFWLDARDCHVAG